VGAKRAAETRPEDLTMDSLGTLSLLARAQ